MNLLLYRIAGLVLGILLLQGCGLHREGVETSPPAAWPTAMGDARMAQETPWQGWVDPELVLLIEEAWESNPDLARIAEQVTMAQAEAAAAGALRRPRLDGNAEASRQRATVPGLGSVEESRFSLGAALSWEVDLWGRLRDRRNAARLQADAAHAEWEAARLSYAAMASRLWYGLQEARLQAELARQTEENFRTSEATVQRRFDAGLTDAMQLAMVRSNRAAVSTIATSVTRQVDQHQRSLETLLGRYPEARITFPRELPPAPDPPPAGIPASVVLQRPDVRAALARVEAADVLAADAAKARLPGLRLTASGGFASAELSDLLSSDAQVGSLVAGLTAPIFDGGRIRAQQRGAEARVRAELASYHATLLEAFREIETALRAGMLIREELALLGQGLADVEEAERIAGDRYERGLVDIAVLLETQRRAFDVRERHLATQALLFHNHMDLILALGGVPWTAEPAHE